MNLASAFARLQLIREALGDARHAVRDGAVTAIAKTRDNRRSRLN